MHCSLWNKIQSNYNQNWNIFIQKNAFKKKYRAENGHLVSASMCYNKNYCFLAVLIYMICCSYWDNQYYQITALFNYWCLYCCCLVVNNNIIFSAFVEERHLYVVSWSRLHDLLLKCSTKFNHWMDAFSWVLKLICCICQRLYCLWEERHVPICCFVVSLLINLGNNCSCIVMIIIQKYFKIFWWLYFWM